MPPDLAALRADLRDYMQHEYRCATGKRIEYRGPCDCGYEEVLAEFEAAIRADERAAAGLPSHDSSS